MRPAAVLDYVSEIKIASPKQVVENLSKIAIPAIALVATSMIQGAQAIPYVECINNCDRHRDAHPLAKLICYALCARFSKG